MYNTVKVVGEVAQRDLRKMFKIVVPVGQQLLTVRVSGKQYIICYVFKDWQTLKQRFVHLLLEDQQYTLFINRVVVVGNGITDETRRLQRPLEKLMKRNGQKPYTGLSRATVLHVPTRSKKLHVRIATPSGQRLNVRHSCPREDLKTGTKGWIVQYPNGTYFFMPRIKALQPPEVVKVKPEVDLEVAAFVVRLSRSKKYNAKEIVKLTRQEFPNRTIAVVNEAVKYAAERMLAQHTLR